MAFLMDSGESMAGRLRRKVIGKRIAVVIIFGKWGELVMFFRFYDGRDGGWIYPFLTANSRLGGEYVGISPEGGPGVPD